MLLAIHPKNPQERLIDEAVACLRAGGVIIYPTDTMYGLGCDIHNKKAVARICQIKGIDPEKAHLSCVCEDLSVIGQYASRVPTPVYKLMKSAFPGPYTFILQASKNIPRHFQHKKTVGIRVVSHPVALRMLKLLEHPIASISLPQDDAGAEFHTQPELIHERYGHLVDLVIDSGPGRLEPSTIIDCSRGEDEITVVRMGSGALEPLGMELAIAEDDAY
ncbi:MAG: L-threonylcarbamoyladenylate synthase [Bacteroidia bacterium]|nr:L-threonylcarbamoyladenylate synthase [Bacteroidia bacterium]